MELAKSLSKSLSRSLGKSLAGGWGSIPYASDALFWLNGIIITIGEDKYFKDITSNGRNFIINNYDFSDDWGKGFPYKSASTISAPVGDTELIAADINNYLYASDGTPNQIPVVSLFQDVDYEHRLFCKHEEQRLVTVAVETMISGVYEDVDIETYEPRVSNMVMYATPKIGSELIVCQKYFKVAPELVGIWSSQVGDDLTGDGTFENPYKSILKGITIATAGGNVLVKSGEYIEAHVPDTGYLAIQKSIKVITVSRVVVKSPTTVRTIGILSSGINLNGIISNESKTSEIVYNATSYVTLELRKLALANQTQKCLLINAGVIDETILQTSAIDRAAIENFANTGILTVKNSRIYGFSYAFLGKNVGEHNLEIKHSKIISDNRGIHCSYEHNISISDSYIFGNICPLSGLGKGVLNLIRNTIKKGTPVTEILTYTGDPVFLPSLSVVENVFITGVTSNLIIKECVDIFLKGNIFKGSETIRNSATVYSTTLATTVQIKNNQFGKIKNGVETGEGDDLMTSNIEGNYIVGPLFYNNEIYTAEHSVAILYQKNTNIIRNKVNGGGLAYVLKHEGADFSLCDFSYNISNNCFRGFVIKGVKNVKLYNNTIYYDLNNLTANFQGLAILDNIDRVTSNNDGLSWINNVILLNTTNSDARIISIEGTTTVYSCDYNVYYSKNGKFATVEGTDFSFEQWQALGYDEHSILLTDAQFADLFPEGQLYPSMPITTGQNLGVNYNTGIDIATNWGDEDHAPVVLTRNQPTNGAWQVGAYVL